MTHPTLGLTDGGTPTGAGVDPDFVRRAVDLAESNALRVALYQATGDSGLLEYRQTTVVQRKGALEKLSIVDEDVPALKEKVVRYLLEHPSGVPEVIPSDAELKSLLGLFLGSEVTEEFVRAQRALVGFDDYPYFTNEWRQGGKAEIPQGFVVAIIGSGFSGVATGVQLDLLGIPYVIYERRHEVGGTWSINRYPGVRVDTLSASYQLGFMKRYPWREHFEPGAGVRQYIEDAAREHGVLDHVRFDHDVTSMTWDEETARWNLEITRAGKVIRTSANVVVSGTGLFATPNLPDFPGVENFGGDILHTTQWPDGYPLEGKSVAVIGNGSTGVQLVPTVAKLAKRLSVFVRTPQWVSPREYYGDPIEPEHQWLLSAMPYYWHWERYLWSVANMGTIVANIFFRDPEWQAKGGLVSEGNDRLRAALIDFVKEQTGGQKDLYERLIPDYPPWSRRMIVDGGWYSTLTEDHVELVTDPIDHLEADAIVTASGERHQADLIISASGFRVTKYMYPITVRGRAGLDLHRHWEASELGPRAFLSMMIPKFPNLFVMYGPNSQGGAPFPANMELWARYVAELLMELIGGGHRVFDVKEDVFEEHNRVLDERTSRMVFMDAGDRNYYVYNGRVQVMGAWSAEEHWHNMTTPCLEENYHLA